MIETEVNIPCQFGELKLVVEVTGPQDEQFITIVDLTVDSVAAAIGAAVHDHLRPVYKTDAAHRNMPTIPVEAQSQMVDGCAFFFRLLYHSHRAANGATIVGTLYGLLQEYAVPQANKQLQGYSHGESVAVGEFSAESNSSDTDD